MEKIVENNGQKLYMKQWISPQEKATMIFLHGIGEHCGRYDELFTFFTSHGISIGSFDQRGFGKTAEFGKKGVSSGIEKTMSDAKFISDLIKKDGIPHFVMGHSMGGGLALRFAFLYPKDFTGVIASAPLIKPGSGSAPNKVEEFLLKYLPKYFPNLVLPNDLDLSNICRDQERLEFYKKDTLIHNKASLQLAADILNNGVGLLDDALTFTLPLFVSHGTKDILTCPNASKEFVERVVSKDKEYKTYQGYYHELHNEPLADRTVVYEDYKNWVLARV
jgi:acylglycerol lipase